MITDDATEVHFGLRLLDRVADHAYCHNYPVVNRVRQLRQLQCWSIIRATLKEASVKWMKLGCVVPVFPLDP